MGENVERRRGGKGRLVSKMFKVKAQSNGATVKAPSVSLHNGSMPQTLHSHCASRGNHTKFSCPSLARIQARA